MTDDAIADWLYQVRPNQDEEQAEEIAADQEAVPADEEPVSGQTAVLPAISENIRLVHVDDKGATFEFSAHKLTEAAFRCAMPRRCIRCGRRSHLEAHIIVYGQMMQDSFSFETGHSENLSITGIDALRLSGTDLLDALPHVPGAPPPADMPMPYWLCEMCTGTGLISGQVQINEETGQGTCRLVIRNLKIAEEFLVAAGGGGTTEHAEFVRYIASRQQHPWESISEAVQHRIGAWYRPAKGEHFVGYVPDRDYPRSQDGLSGIVLSNYRMIYHTRMRQREAMVGDKIRLEAPETSGRIRLRVKTPTWELRRMTVDREGLEEFRRAIKAAKFNAVWY